MFKRLDIVVYEVKELPRSQSTASNNPNIYSEIG